MQLKGLLYSVLLISGIAQAQDPQATLQAAAVTGAQLVVVKQGKTQTYVHGFANQETRQKVTDTTIFQAASLSKVVLAYITLQLADEGTLSLDTALFHYYANPRVVNDPKARTVTARMVLHHTSGFPNWASNPTQKQWATSPLATRFTPGSDWGYSGEGFMFLQAAIETLTHQSLEQLARTRVFTPLGMHHSGFIWRPAFDSSTADGHNQTGAVTGHSEFFLPAGAYSLLTTATDYSTFLMALMEGRGLSKPTRARLLSDTVSVQKKGAVNEAARHIWWTLGVGLQQNELGPALWHWGDNGDFKCFFMAFPERRESMMLLTNSVNGLQAMEPLLKLYFGPATWWSVKWLNTAF
ncbi:MAG TPA: serine hydrolase domain-containing protein [Flavisolibacter sp.]|jgi:CubicO group peptidase (beta-lactamase class C family)|nr:serine hydrolase domain-containing protein [Flavisolibacter sp.]